MEKGRNPRCRILMALDTNITLGENAIFCFTCKHNNITYLISPPNPIPETPSSTPPIIFFFATQ